MTKVPIIVFCFIFLFAISSKVFAGTFQLKSIGSVQVNGAIYKHWWIVGSNPRFAGSALPNSVVTIVVDGTTSSVTSNGSGDWSFTPPTLKDGDHEVSFASGGSSIYFTLTTGNAIPSGIQAPPEQQLPVSGSAMPLAGLLIGGISLMGFGYKLRRG